MSFFGGSSNDDRRRRVLTDEVIGARHEVNEGATPRRRATDRPAAPGTHPSVIDLIPQRYSVIALFTTLGLLAVAALAAGHYFMPEIAAFAGTTHLPAFDIDGANSLAVWFSSFTRGAAAVVALLIYIVRRHKADDYHGRYRIWLWAAAGWLLLSVDAVAHLHETFEIVMVHHAGDLGPGTGFIWWVAGYALLLGPICTRLVLDMRRCRSSTTVLTLAVTCYLASTVAKIGVLFPQSDVTVILVEGAGQLLGNVLLLLAMTLHARYVIRDALGLLPPETKTAKEKKAAAKVKADTSASSSSSAAKRSDLDTPKSATAASSSSRSHREEDDDDYEDDTPQQGQQRYRVDDEDDYSPGRKLNKSARKVMRRQKEQQRRGDHD
ncbi:MAG: hypothetical protein JSS27_00690 [Planctomycetes bacterium]|nr:hypothetical protein [Planctomycetota bacterium]